MKKDNSKDEKVIDGQSNKIEVTDNTLGASKKLEPKRIKIPLIILILFFIMILTGALVGAFILLQSYLQ